MKKIKRFFICIPIILIGSLIIKRDYSNIQCYGIADGFTNLILNGAIIIITVIYLFIFLWHFKRFKNFYDYLPVIIIVSTISFIAIEKLWPEDTSRVILKANYRNENAYSLSLFQNKKFVAQMKEFDFSCRFKGSYSIEKDTLKLHTDIFQTNNSPFRNSYIIKDSFLIPTYDVTDTSGILIIDNYSRIKMH